MKRKKIRESISNERRKCRNENKFEDEENQLNPRIKRHVDCTSGKDATLTTDAEISILSHAAIRTTPG